MNRIDIIGWDVDISNFLHAGRKPGLPDKVAPFSFESFLPLPDAVDANAWRKKNWGTVSDIGADAKIDIVLEDSKTKRVTILFPTAWEPPDEAIYAISKKFPNLMFIGAYEEAGNGFFGGYAFSGSNVHRFCSTHRTSESADYPDESDFSVLDSNDKDEEIFSFDSTAYLNAVVVKMRRAMEKCKQTISSNKDLTDRKEKSANQVFEDFDFDAWRVESGSGWEMVVPGNIVSKSVFLSYPTHPELFDEISKATFSVVFKDENSDVVVDCYASLSNGNRIGFWPDVKSPEETQSPRP